jgi:hypothetical protein
MEGSFVVYSEIPAFAFRRASLLSFPVHPLLGFSGSSNLKKEKIHGNFF